MKISQVIEQLQERLSYYGDHEVYLAFPPDDPDGECEIEYIHSHHLHELDVKPMITCISGIDPDKAD